MRKNKKSMKINLSNSRRHVGKKEYEKMSLSLFEKIIKQKLTSKYSYDSKMYYRQVITQLIFNQSTRIVSLFKDNLISNDNSEFLKRFYKKKESYIRLDKYFDYYNTYSKIYPNYTSIPEGKYFYMNIQKKQKLIDLQEEIEFKAKVCRKMKKKKNEKSLNFFSTDVYDSIIKDRNNEDMLYLFGLDLDKDKKELTLEEEFNISKIEMLINLISKYSKMCVESGPIKEENTKEINTSITMKEKSKTDRNTKEKLEIKYLKFLKFNKSQNSTISLNNLQKESFLLKNASFLNRKCKNSDNSKNRKTRNNTKDSFSHRIRKNTNSNSPSIELINNNLINYSIEKKGNNIIYIINQNPKFTTQVNFYKNSHTQNQKNNKNVVLTRRVQSSFIRRETAKDSSKTKSHSKNSNDSQTKSITYETLSNKQPKKTKNFLYFLQNSNFQTAREIGYKDLHLLKTSSKQGEKSKEKKNKEIDNNNINNNNFISRNNNKLLSCDSLSQRKMKTNSISRGSFLEMTNNINKNIIKGIHIKNFSKIFNVNQSQIRSKQVTSRKK